MSSERDNEPYVRLNLSRNPSAGLYIYFCQTGEKPKQGTIPQSDCLADRLSQILDGIPPNKEILVTSTPTRGLDNRNAAFLTPTQLREIADGLSKRRSDLYFALSSPRPRFND